MNKADFNTNPAGFPLEADATLGFLQENLMSAIEGLAKLMRPDGVLVPVIVSGCERSGGSLADGWVLHTTGELIFFEGGSIGATCIIEETAVSKNNLDGTPVNRYFTRKMKFGSGVGSFSFSPDVRIGSLTGLADQIYRAASAGGNSGDWVILFGMGTVTGGSGGIQAGIAMKGYTPVSAGSYNSPVSVGSPVWLGTDGAWSTSDPGGGLKFEPYTTKHMRTLQRNKLHAVGAFLPFKSGVAELTTFFDGSGLGFGEWLGWAVANSNNGTLNLGSAISGVVWVQRLS
jgi:hypothetical protein